MLVHIGSCDGNRHHVPELNAKEPARARCNVYLRHFGELIRCAALLIGRGDPTASASVEKTVAGH